MKKSKWIIEVLLVYLPYPAPKDARLEVNSVYAVAEEYGVNYINFVEMDNVVDYTTDCYDSGSHLNPSGARKVTDYLGRYMKEHYNIPDRRNDKNYGRWFDDYETYTDYKINNINNQKVMEQELMLLADKNFSVCIYIKGGSRILRRASVCNLITKLSGRRNVKGLGKAAKTDKSYCLVVDNG